MPEGVILDMKGISKSYPGVTVFDDFDFDLRKGEIHCICGENGAGKSTLIKMLSGAHAPDSGEIFFEGNKVEGLSPRAAMKMGIQTIYQEHNLFPMLNVVENLYAGNEMTSGIIINKARMVAKAKEILEYLHSDISPFDIVGRLGSGAQKTVEISKALVQESKVIILDEPTASFSQAETAHLFRTIKKLVQNGLSIIYISHHLEEVFSLADRVTVIRDGKKINTYDIADLTEQKLIHDMVGRDVSLFYQRPRLPVGEVVFEARDLSGNGVSGASFSVRKGEILGISGMVGSGRTELAELVFGAKKCDSGEIRVNGSRVRMRSPLSAIEHRLCFITEDRQASGLFLKHTLEKNIPIVSYRQTKTPFAFPRDDVKLSQRYIDALNIMTPSVFQLAMLLSGGNQQKVVLARWFNLNKALVVLEEPTAGVDVGAKRQIYEIVRERADAGTAIAVVSTDFEEVATVCTRVLVFRNGLIAAELQGDAITVENLLTLAAGGAAHAPLATPELETAA